MHVPNLLFPFVLTQSQYIGNWSSSTPGEDVNLPDNQEADHHPLHHRRPVGGTTKTKWRPTRLMFLGPLKSSQAGTQISDNIPASSHRQKPVEPSPTSPTQYSLSPTSTHQGRRGSHQQDWWFPGPLNSELSGWDSDCQHNPSLTSLSRASGVVNYIQAHLSSSPDDVHYGLALPEQEDTLEEVQQVVKSLHTCSPGGPVSSFVLCRCTQDRVATPRWCLSGLVQNRQSQTP